MLAIQDHDEDIEKDDKRIDPGGADIRRKTRLKTVPGLASSEKLATAQEGKAAASGGSTGALSADQLSETESSSEGSLFHPESDSKERFAFARKAKTKLTGKAGVKKKKGLLFFALGGIGASSLIIVILILIIMAGSLAIPNLAQNISSWQFARTSRLFRLSVQSNTEEKIAIDAATDTANQSMKSRFEKYRFWSVLDGWRPEKVVDNLKTTGVLQYEYGEPQGLTRRKPIVAVVINGERTPISETSWLHPVENYNNKINFSASMDAGLEESLRGTNSLVRSSVANKIREEVGVKSLVWWEKKGTGYNGLKDAEANRLEAKKTYETIKGDAEPSATGVQQIDDAARATEEAIDGCVTNDTCLDQAMADAREGKSSLPAVAEEAANSKLNVPALTALEFASTTYGIAVPLCIIYDGSLQKSGETIDQKNEMLQRSYNGLMTAANQQMAGETTAKAIGATVRNMGNTNGSIPQQRGAGKPVDTSGITSPQGSSYGDFTLFNAILGGGTTTDALNTIASACPVLTDWKTGVATGTVELVVGFFTGESSEAGAKFIELGVKKGLTEYTAKLAGEIFTKKTAKRFIGEAAATAGGTLAAKLLVMSKAGVEQNGLQTNEIKANNEDMGGALSSNEQNRKMFYGAPLTKESLGYNDMADRQYLAQQQSKKSPYERYVAMDNPQSLLSNVAVGLSSRVGNMQSLASFIGSIPSSFSRLGTMFLGLNTRAGFAAAASTTSNYNIIAWGDTEEETALIQNNQDYRPLRNAELLAESHKADEIEAAYGSCYTDTQGTMISGQQVVRDENGNVVADKGKCSPQNLGVHNPTYGDKVFRWRLEKRNTATVNHMVDMQTIVDNATSTAVGGVSLDPNLPTGSNEELISQINATGNVTLESGASFSGVKNTMLAVYLKLAQKYKLRVSSTVRPGCNCPHGNGAAIDTDGVGGKAPNYGSVDTEMQQFLTDAAGILPKGSWIGFPNEQYKSETMKTATPRGVTGDIDRGTGPHFHLNVPADAP